MLSLMCTVSLVTTVNVQHFTELKATQAILLLVIGNVFVYTH